MIATSGCLNSDRSAGTLLARKGIAIRLGTTHSELDSVTTLKTRFQQSMAQVSTQSIHRVHPIFFYQDFIVERINGTQRIDQVLNPPRSHFHMRPILSSLFAKEDLLRDIQCEEKSNNSKSNPLPDLTSKRMNWSSRHSPKLS
jgi:hypothetical protein